jgi:predicted nucleic acid-binding protein
VSGTLLDTSVLSDVLDPSSAWNQWSSDALLLALARGPLIINPIVFAEISIPYESPDELAAMIDPDIERRALPWAAAFLAGKAFQRYRRRGGTRTSPLPDFYIGAHAAVEQLDVLTRDPRRVTSYFHTVNVIAPPA